MTPYGKIFQILFGKDSSRHRLIWRVVFKSREIWPTANRWSRALLIWQKNNISPGSSALATAQIATEICQGHPPPIECTQSAPAFIQIGSLSVELFPNAWTPSKRAVQCFQHSAEAWLKQPILASFSTDRICIPEKSHKMLHGPFVHEGKTLTDLQILGCELHQNAFGGRAPPGPAGGAIALPQTL